MTDWFSSGSKFGSGVFSVVFEVDILFSPCLEDFLARSGPLSIRVVKIVSIRVYATLSLLDLAAIFSILGFESSVFFIRRFFGFI